MTFGHSGNCYSPEHGEQKHTTQIISMFVGVVLIIIGLAVILFSGFAGLHLSAPYSEVIAIAGWGFGEPGTLNVGFDRPDPKWLQIIPNFHELGRNDHILNTVLSLVVLGETIDWWRRHTSKGNRKEV